MVVEGPSRSGSERDADGLLLGVEIDRVVAALAPDAAVLHSTEGHSQVTLRYQSSSHHVRGEDDGRVSVCGADAACDGKTNKWRKRGHALSQVFTQTVPLLISCATLWARLRFSVQTLEARPYSTLLAISMASSSVSNGVTVTCTAPHPLV